MTKLEALNLYNALNKLGNLTGVRFTYAIARNLRLLTPEIESLQKAIDVTPAYTAYETARIELAKEHAKKDDAGNPVSEKNEAGIESYVLEDESVFEEAFEALKLEHTEALDARKAQFDEYNELLKTEASVELYTVRLLDVPEAISAQQMASIEAMIRADE